VGSGMIVEQPNDGEFSEVDMLDLFFGADESTAEHRPHTTERAEIYATDLLFVEDQQSRAEILERAEIDANDLLFVEDQQSRAETLEADRQAPCFLIGGEECGKKDLYGEDHETGHPIFWMQIGNAMVPLTQSSALEPQLPRAHHIRCLTIPEARQQAYLMHLLKLLSEHSPQSMLTNISFITEMQMGPEEANQRATMCNSTEHQELSPNAAPYTPSHCKQRWDPWTSQERAAYSHCAPGQLPRGCSVEGVEKAQQDVHRVTIWNPTERRKISGNAAPFMRNLTSYLQLHPEWEVYTDQDGDNKKRNKKRKRRPGTAGLHADNQYHQ